MLNKYIRARHRQSSEVYYPIPDKAVYRHKSLAKLSLSRNHGLHPSAQHARADVIDTDCVGNGKLYYTSGMSDASQSNARLSFFVIWDILHKPQSPSPKAELGMIPTDSRKLPLMRLPWTTPFSSHLVA